MLILAFVLLAIGCFASGWHFNKHVRQRCRDTLERIGPAKREGAFTGTIFASPLYVLNLERRTDRREEMSNQVREHPHVVWIKAVDGKALMKGNPYFYPDCKMTPGQIGCFMSHALAWEALVRSDLDFGTVVEDDVLITYPFDFVRLNLALQAV